MFDFNKVWAVNHSQPCSLDMMREVPYDFGQGEKGSDLVPMTLEEQIEYAARVSNPSAQDKMASGEIPQGKLTQYLIRNGHWSPLEMVSVTMKIVTTRDIARQILRHRSFSFQEFSTRYAEVDFQDFVLKAARSQDLQNRQNSNDDMSDTDKAWWNNVQGQLLTETVDQYKAALKRGVAKEVARVILPEGLTPSTLFMAGTVRSWYHYVGTREANGTQLEHMDIANKAKSELTLLMPNLFGE